MHTSEPLSYWHRTTQEMALATDLPASAEYVVIGAGYLGASTCYWLARAGANVVLLEQARPTFGATGRNGGFLTLGPAAPYTRVIQQLGHRAAKDVLQVTLDSRSLLRQVLAEEQIACDYRESGTLSLTLNPEHLAAFAQQQRALLADGVAVQLLDHQQLQELIATPLSSDILGGLFTPETALVHPARLVQGLLAAAQRHRARLVTARVHELVSSDSDATITLHTSQGTLRAQHVLVAANAWTGDLLHQLSKIVIPVRGQVLSYMPLPPVFTTGIGADITQTGEYWQQTLDGSIVLGGCRVAAPHQDIGVRTSQPTDEVQQALEHILPHLFPRLSGLRVNHRWAGLMAFTPDYLPIADKVPGTNGVWVVAGFSGHGMPFGMRLGNLLAESLVRGVVSHALHPFRLARPSLNL